MGELEPPKLLLLLILKSPSETKQVDPFAAVLHSARLITILSHESVPRRLERAALPVWRVLRVRVLEIQLPPVPAGVRDVVLLVRRGDPAGVTACAVVPNVLHAGDVWWCRQGRARWK
eukprot:SAG11_NODE_663_length_7869_cov_146.101158_1_plen_118_part_00